LAAGAVTALALTVQTGLAAVVGVVIAREFGRTAETDGFFASYGVFVTLALAATAIRVTVLPRFARARARGRLASEVLGVARAVGLVTVPFVVAALVARHPLASLLTGLGPAEARAVAADTLPWMALAAAGQLSAGLLASAFAALDEYLVPALGYVVGSVSGLALIVLRVGPDGIRAVAWGIALNAFLATVIPAALLARRARRERMPSTALQSQSDTLDLLRELGAGVAVPFGLQVIYLVCLPIAARDGVGAVTSFGYGFLLGSAVVSVTAASIGLVTSVPLTRAGLDSAGVARHVVASSWLALLAVAATGGCFAVGGEALVAPVLGAGFESDVGRELGGVVVALVPWMVATIGITVVFPLVFVEAHASGLPRVALVALAVHVPLAFAGQALAGLTGLALALAVSTFVALWGMLRLLGASGRTARGIAPAILVVSALAAAAYLTAGLALDGVAAAAAGTALYVVLVALIRPKGLRVAWRYLHQLA
jgi:hypothetical protein